MAEIRKRISGIDFRTLPRTKHTIAMFGGPKLYQEVLSGILGSSPVVKKEYALVNVTNKGISLNFICPELVFEHVIMPGLSYTGSEWQWQIAIPDR